VRLPIIALATALLISMLPTAMFAQTELGVLDVWLKMGQSANALSERKITLYTKSKALVIGIDWVFDNRSLSEIPDVEMC
jgi:hypothetical protein